jgi:hypothetical protein
MRWIDSGWVPVTLIGLAIVIAAGTPATRTKADASVSSPKPIAVTVMSGGPKATLLKWKFSLATFSHLFSENKAYRGSLPPQQPSIRFGFYNGPVVVSVKTKQGSYTVRPAYRLVPEKSGYRIRYFSPVIEVESGTHTSLYSNPALYYWLRHDGHTENPLSRLISGL